MEGARTEFCSKNTIFLSQGTTDGAGNLQPIEGTRQRAYDVFKVIVQISYCSALFLSFFLSSNDYFFFLVLKTIPINVGNKRSICN